MIVKKDFPVCPSLYTNLDFVNLDPMKMIYNYDRFFANYRLDLCTIYQRLAKINVRECSAQVLEENRRIAINKKKKNKDHQSITVHTMHGLTVKLLLTKSN